MNKIIFLCSRYLEKRDFVQFGIGRYQKNKIKVEIWYLNQLVKRNYKTKKFKLHNIVIKEIKNLISLESEIKKNLSNCLYNSKINYNFDTMQIYKLLSKYNANYLVQASMFSKKQEQKGKIKNEIKNKLNLLIKKKFFHIKKIIFYKMFNLTRPSFFGIKKAKYVYLMGKESYLNRKNHKLVGKKTGLIWGHHRSYDDFLRGGTIKLKTKRKKALYIDSGAPYGPDLIELGLNDLKPNSYYRSVKLFLKKLNKKFGYKIEISCHPKIGIKNLRKHFRSFPIKIHKTISQVMSSDLIVLHDSTARNFAIMYKKPVIFITNNEELKSAYNHYGETSKIANLVNKQPLNIDICSYADIKNNLILNRKTYQDYFKKFIKFKGEKKIQPEIIIKKLKNDRIWI
jgi:hypothetical protein